MISHPTLGVRVRRAMVTDRRDLFVSHRSENPKQTKKLFFSCQQVLSHPTCGVHARRAIVNDHRNVLETFFFPIHRSSKI